ncbi:MEMO1 family, partial [Entophlyctis helioformis]
MWNITPHDKGTAPAVSRKASHAGSWYTESGAQLSKQLDAWLDKADVWPNPSVRAIIAPHAGYSYSGPAAAWAYKNIDPQQVERVFILGPSHHAYIQGCALSQCTEYETPLGNLVIDRKVVGDLKATGKFETMSLKTDEDEHSIEMHLPYVFKIMSRKQGPYTIVPILVGATKPAQERLFGQLLSPYLADPSNLFVISSDFCHWGSRFQYTVRVDKSLPIHASIEKLDREGMSAIQTRQPSVFESYLQRTQNTICGRHPIGVLLNAVDEIARQRGQAAETRGRHAAAGGTGSSVSAGGLVKTDSQPGDTADEMEIKFVHYAQSSRIVSERDSSVSYASAYVSIPV